MRSVELSNLLYNPIWTSQLLHYYISGACDSKSGKLKFELIYFGLPFFFDELIFEKLSSSKKSSTITTLFNSPELKNKLVLMPQRIEAFKTTTNHGLIYLGNKVDLTLQDFIEVSQKVHYKNELDLTKKTFFKAAFNLGQIITKEDYKNIFVRLEIVNI